MRNLSILLGFAFLAACGGTSASDPGTSQEDLTTSSRNEDVQVLKVYDGPSFSVAKGSIYPTIDQEKCKPEGLTWEAIKQHDTETDGPLPVTLDCTDAFTEKYGLPTMRAVKLQGYRSRKSLEGYYGYVGFADGGGAFWTKTVELVVKQATVDAASLHGVGFYLNSFEFPYYQRPPAPGPDNGNGYFLFADQVRAQAGTYPAATLRSGDQARVIKVLLPSPYALGGTSYVPAFYFRPFAEYVVGEDKHQRWDSVATDYFVTHSTQFNREGDVLAH